MAQDGRRGRWHGIACLGVALALGCGGDSSRKSDAGVDAAGADTGVGPGAPCRSDRTCLAGERCATAERVHEMELEAGDEGRCVQRERLIGAAPVRWEWAPGGRPLAARLCTAQGLAEGAGTPADASRARQQELLRAAGTRMIRLDIRWALVQPEPGAFDFSAVDPMIDAAVEIGLEPIALLVYGVPWASSVTEEDDTFPPDDPADYAAFARAVTEHFAGRIRHFELWNEPNAGFRFFMPNLHGDAAHYADLMVAAADAISGACADCVVYGVGPFFHEQLVNGAIEFTHDLLTARPAALSAIDVLAFHPYALYPPAAPPEANDDGERALGGMVADLREVLALHGASPGLPLAATELGWPSYGDVDERTQAAWLARAVVLGASLGLDPMCWYNLTDGPSHGSFPPEDDFGLYRYGSEDPDGTIAPKPARDAMAWMATVGEGAVPAGALEDPALHDPEHGRFALVFEGGRRGTWFVTWRSADAGGSGEEGVVLAAETRLAYDLTGGELARPDAAGTLAFEVGEEPVFVVPPPP